MIETDVLVLGSGIAGLRAAVGLAGHGRVLVVIKDQPTESNTGDDARFHGHALFEGGVPRLVPVATPIAVGA